MTSTQFSYVTRNKRFHCARIWKRSDAAISHLLNNLIWWLAGGITLLTEVSEPADPNRNRSSSKWASIPFTRNFSGYLGLGPFARWSVEWVGLAHRVNGSGHYYSTRFLGILHPCGLKQSIRSPSDGEVSKEVPKEVRSHHLLPSFLSSLGIYLLDFYYKTTESFSDICHNNINTTSSNTQPSAVRAAVGTFWRSKMVGDVQSLIFQTLFFPRSNNTQFLTAGSIASFLSSSNKE